MDFLKKNSYSQTKIPYPMKLEKMNIKNKAYGSIHWQFQIILCFQITEVLFFQMSLWNQVIIEPWLLLLTLKA